MIKEGQIIRVRLGDSEFTADILRKDEANDIAVLRLRGADSSTGSPVAGSKRKPLFLGSSAAVREGERVFTVGFPLVEELGRRPRIGEGIVSSNVGIEGDPRMFQVSIPIQPGNSGGPLFNSKGEVIGMITSTIDNTYLMKKRGSIGQNVNFAIRVSYLKALVSQLPIEGPSNLPKSPRSYDAEALMELVKESVLLIEVQSVLKQEETD